MYMLVMASDFCGILVSISKFCRVLTFRDMNTVGHIAAELAETVAGWQLKSSGRNAQTQKVSVAGSIAAQV